MFYETIETFFFTETSSIWEWSPTNILTRNYTKLSMGVLFCLFNTSKLVFTQQRQKLGLRRKLDVENEIIRQKNLHEGGLYFVSRLKTKRNDFLSLKGKSPENNDIRSYLFPSATFSRYHGIRRPYVQHNCCWTTINLPLTSVEHQLSQRTLIRPGDIPANARRGPDDSRPSIPAP